MLSDTAALFLDAAKVFNKVWHNGLLFKLRLIALPDSLVHINREYLSNDTFRYRNKKGQYRPLDLFVMESHKVSHYHQFLRASEKLSFPLSS